MKTELEKAEYALAIETNLNQKSFYEGYIKGLKFQGPKQPSKWEKELETVMNIYDCLVIRTQEEFEWGRDHVKQFIFKLLQKDREYEYYKITKEMADAIDEAKKETKQETKEEIMKEIKRIR